MSTEHRSRALAPEQPVPGVEPDGRRLRSAVRCRGTSCGVVLLLGIGLVLGAPAAGPAQTEGGGQATANDALELSATVQEVLLALNDDWLILNSAVLQDDRVFARDVVNDMLARVDALGLKALPDPALGLILRGVEMARADQIDRARWVLGLAEELDPGRAETSLAVSRVAWLEGAYGEALAQRWRSWVRLTLDPLQRETLLRDAVVLVATCLLLTGYLWILVQFASRGERVWTALSDSMPKALPDAAKVVLTAVVLLWPALFPQPWLWLPLYWLIFLWSYQSSSERRVSVAFVLIVGLVPPVLDWQERAISVALSDENRSVSQVVQGRLYGNVFRDLQRLSTTLPLEPAARQLVADFYMTLGQDHFARRRYVRLLEQEPENAAALNNVGCYHFHRAEYLDAIEYFQQSAAADEDAFEPRYNISQAYHNLLEFSEADRYLAEARAIDSDRLMDLIESSEGARLILAGYERTGEIRSALTEALRGTSAAWGRRLSVLPIAFLPLVLALLLQRLWGRGRSSSESRSMGKSPLMKVGEVMVPGWVSAQEGKGGLGFLALLLPVTALLLPHFQRIGFLLPLRYFPAGAAGWVSAVLLLLIFTVRAVRR